MVAEGSKGLGDDFGAVEVISLFLFLTLGLSPSLLLRHSLLLELKLWTVPSPINLNSVLRSVCLICDEV